MSVLVVLDVIHLRAAPFNRSSDEHNPRPLHTAQLGETAPELRWVEDGRGEWTEMKLGPQYTH